MFCARPTVAAWCRALAEFPGGEDGFRDWLRHEALAAKLKRALRDLLRARLPDPAAVRAEIHAVRNAGPDPDQPPPLLHRLAMVSSLWGFAADGAREYSAALAAGDWRALRELPRQNRAFVARGQRDFSRMVGAAFRPAPAPVLPAR